MMKVSSVPGESGARLSLPGAGLGGGRWAGQCRGTGPSATVAATAAAGPANDYDDGNPARTIASTGEAHPTLPPPHCLASFTSG